MAFIHYGRLSEGPDERESEFAIRALERARDVAFHPLTLRGLRSLIFVRNVILTPLSTKQATAMDQRTTYLSFWHVELSNLPVGTFRRRVLSTAEARDIVNSARTSGKLVCVAKDDLGAPYCERQRERHEQLCAALRDHDDVDVHLKDFFGSHCSNPLCLAEVGEKADLVVVDCAYAMDGEARVDTAHAGVSDPAESFEARARQLAKDALRMNIAPDTIKFHVLEQVEG